MAIVIPDRDQFRAWLKDPRNRRGPATDDQADTLVRLYFDGMGGDDFIELSILAGDEYHRMKGEI
jgi:hypothetical protein